MVGNEGKHSVILESSWWSQGFSTVSLLFTIAHSFNGAITFIDSIYGGFSSHCLHCLYRYFPAVEGRGRLDQVSRCEMTLWNEGGAKQNWMI